MNPLYVCGINIPEMTYPQFIDKLNHFSRANENLFFAFVVEIEKDKEKKRIYFPPSSQLAAALMMYDESKIRRLLFEDLKNDKKRIAAGIYDLLVNPNVSKREFVDASAKLGGLATALSKAYESEADTKHEDRVNDLIKQYTRIEDEFYDSLAVFEALKTNKKDGFENLFDAYKLKVVYFSGHALTAKFNSKTDGKDHLFNQKGILVLDDQQGLKEYGNLSINSSVPLTSYSQVKYEFDEIVLIDHYASLILMALMGYDVAEKITIKKDTNSDEVLDTLPVFMPFEPLADPLNSTKELRRIVRKGLYELFFGGWKRVNLDAFLLAHDEIYSDYLRKWKKDKADETLGKVLAANWYGYVFPVGFEERSNPEIAEKFNGDVEFRENGHAVKLYRSLKDPKGNYYIQVSKSGGGDEVRLLNSNTFEALRHKEICFTDNTDMLDAKMEVPGMSQTYVKIKWERDLSLVTYPFWAIRLDNGIKMYPWSYKMRKLKKKASAQSP